MNKLKIILSADHASVILLLTAKFSEKIKSKFYYWISEIFGIKDDYVRL